MVQPAMLLVSGIVLVPLGIARSFRLFGWLRPLRYRSRSFTREGTPTGRGMLSVRRADARLGLWNMSLFGEPGPYVKGVDELGAGLLHAAVGRVDVLQGL